MTDMPSDVNPGQEAERTAETSPKSEAPASPFGAPYSAKKRSGRVTRYLADQGGRCIICGKIASADPDAGDPLTVHHFIPRTLAGADIHMNRTAAHKSCNNRQAGRVPTLIHWFRYLRMQRRRGLMTWW